MPNLSPISPSPRVEAAEHAQAHRDRATPPASRADNQPAPARGADRVELSEMAKYLSMLKELPEVRQDLVERVRQEIETGEYETPERLEQAAEEVIRELDLLA